MIIYTSWLNHLRRYITLSRDGALCMYNDKLKLQKAFTDIHSSVYGNDDKKCLGTSAGMLRKGGQHANPWAHDAVFMSGANKLAVGWASHEITIHDMNSMDVHYCLDLEDATALSIDFYYNPDDLGAEALLFWGTDTGHVAALQIEPDTLLALSGPKKDYGAIVRDSCHAHFTGTLASFNATNPNSNSGKEGASLLSAKNGNNIFIPVNTNNIPNVMPSSSSNMGGFDSFAAHGVSTNGPRLGTLQKRKAHGDWCVKVKYLEDLGAVVSCSPDPQASLVVSIHRGRWRWDSETLAVHKGVNAFAYCRFPVTLVTGGTDRHVRFWNPHRLKRPIAILKGHVAPISDIVCNETHGQAITMSVDKVVRVWDIRRQQCLQTLTDTIRHRPENIISSLHFSPQNLTLVVASTTLQSYVLSEKRTTGVLSKTPRTHDHPLRSALYNANFRQVISGCDGGVVNVWDATTGAKTFRFQSSSPATSTTTTTPQQQQQAAQMSSSRSEITAMTFDCGRRRIVIGSRDGSIRMYNFNNGQCLHELIKGDDSEVTGLVYIELKDAKYIIATGWSRRVAVFLDDSESFALEPTLAWPSNSTTASTVMNSSWHRDDVLSAAFCPPTMLATSSYDGEIILSTLMTGHIIHRMKPPLWEFTEPQKRSLDKVLFLPSRINNLNAAALISSGSDGIIRFWNVWSGAEVHEFDAVQGRQEGVFALAVNEDDTLVVTGDTAGYVALWNIKDTCSGMSFPTNGIETVGLVYQYRAHVRSIVSVDIAEQYRCVVTASTDMTVRMFTYEGLYVGTFGQSWDILNPDTWMGVSPDDVLAIEAQEAEEREELARVKSLSNKVKERFMSPKFKKQAALRSQSAIKAEAISVTSDKMLQETNTRPTLASTTCQTSPEVLAIPAPATEEQVPVKPDQPQVSSVTNYGSTIFAKELGSKLPHKKTVKELQIKDSYSQRVYQLLNHHEIAEVIEIAQPASLNHKHRSHV
ncbi:hypothetical protein SeMB42_g04804 [Synchytrium endobioticum]|nr:hypothetical protein SeMB42_g04804 [Synchytrium endobioticum]